MNYCGCCCCGGGGGGGGVVVVENSSPAVDPGLYDPWCFMKPKGSIASQNFSDNFV